MVTLQVTTGRYESYAHKLLWESSCRHFALAVANPEDSWFLHLSAGLLAAAAFEAYLNYVGEEMLPQVWQQERAFFSQQQYKGTFGKLKRIAEEIGWELPRKDRQPLSGVIELQSLRDKMVHGRSVRVEYKKTHRSDQWPQLPGGWLAAETRPQKIQHLVARVEEFTVSLHTAILHSEFQHCVIGAHPLLGMLSFGTHSATAA